MKSIRIALGASVMSLALALSGIAAYAENANPTRTVQNPGQEQILLTAETMEFDNYSSFGTPINSTYGILAGSDGGEQKAVIKNLSARTLQAEFTVYPSPADSGKINGGMYFHAKDFADDVDGVDGLNVNIDKDADTDYYRAYIYDFTDGAYTGIISNTPYREYTGAGVKVKVVVDEERLDVYLDDETVPAITKNLAFAPKDGTSVGFRSFYATQTFRNVSITNVLDRPQNPTVKVLMVGNSYAQDAMTYAHALAASAGVNMICGVMYYGGCTVQQHANFLAQNKNVYTYFKNGGTDRQSVTFDDILSDEDWDYITIQTGQGLQGSKETFYPYIRTLIAHIENSVPAAEVGLFESWAVPSCYENTGNSRLSRYNDNSEFMYQQIIKTFKELHAENGTAFVIPSAEGLHRINATSVCDNSSAETSFFRDSTAHVNEKGRYMLGLMMFRSITGRSLSSVTYMPVGYSYGDVPGIDQATAAVVKEVVEGLYESDYTSMNALPETVAIRYLTVENAKIAYAEGEYFDYASMNVYAVYTDGAKKPVEYYNIDIMRPLVKGDDKVTVSYKGKTAAVYINVN